MHCFHRKGQKWIVECVQCGQVLQDIDDDENDINDTFSCDSSGDVPDAVRCEQLAVAVDVHVENMSKKRKLCSGSQSCDNDDYDYELSESLKDIDDRADQSRKRRKHINDTSGCSKANSDM